MQLVEWQQQHVLATLRCLLALLALGFAGVATNRRVNEAEVTQTLLSESDSNMLPYKGAGGDFGI